MPKQTKMLLEFVGIFLRTVFLLEGVKTHCYRTHIYLE